MANTVDALSGWLGEADWPRVSCPTCEIGSVGFDLAQRYPNPKSQAHLDEMRHHGGPHEELEGSFSGSMKCDNAKCNQVLAMAGKWGYFVNEGDPKHGQFVDLYQLRHVTPPLLLLRVPSAAPKVVKESVTTASDLLWASPSAAANQLRQGVEALLTAKGIAKTVMSSKGKRVWLKTHERIQRYKQSQPRVAEALEAVKWIGNSGSHEGGMTVSQVFQGAEILELALRDLYDRTDEQLMAKVRKINKRKGI